MIIAEELAEANEIDSSGQTSAVNYGKLYGGLKALCEQAVQEVIPNRVLIIRPGLIVGPYDNTDRFTYWVVRCARGGEVLAPARPDRYVQFIDARDLAEWTVRMIEHHQMGVYNANCSPKTVSMGKLLEECKTVSGATLSLRGSMKIFCCKRKSLRGVKCRFGSPKRQRHT